MSSVDGLVLLLQSTNPYILGAFVLVPSCALLARLVYLTHLWAVLFCVVNMFEV